MSRRALFLDRDGVINVDHGYVHRPEEFDFEPGIFDLVRAANKRDFLVIVVTNQAGIGRGYYTEAQFHALTRWMVEQFASKGGVIDGVYFCPYHPEHGVGSYRRESEYRKPNPGMLLLAAREHGIDLPSSILVGDALSDIEAAEAAGISIRFLYHSVQSCADAQSVSHLSEVEHYLRSVDADSRFTHRNTSTR